MKTRLTFLIMLLAVGAYAQHDHQAESAKAVSAAPSFADKKIELVYQRYITLKDALVSSTLEDAKKAALSLKESLGALPDAKNALTFTDKILSASVLNVQREAFSALSDEMAKIVKANKLSAGAVYVAYCPMANDNQGAYWLSNEKEIKNPYFGNMMLRCGAVKETIQ